MAMRFTGGGWVFEENDTNAPIIDAHYHIFPRLGSQKSGIAPQLRLKFWQYHSREWNNFWRVADGRHTAEQFLQFDSGDIDQMPDVDFRLTDCGQAHITVEGIHYRLQIYPPSLTNNEATPQRMVAEMDQAGVAMGVLQCDHVYGDLAEYFGAAMRDYPGRFIGLGQIWEPEADEQPEQPPPAPAAAEAPALPFGVNWAALGDAQRTPAQRRRAALPQAKKYFLPNPVSKPPAAVKKKMFPRISTYL